MKNLYQRILASLNFSGRDWAVFLLALLLAFSVWLIHNLGLKYNDYLNVSVAIVSNIEGHSEQSSNKCEVIARCRATGYNVITSSHKSRRGFVSLELKPSELKHFEGDVFFLRSEDLRAYAHIIYGNDVTVEYFVSDTLFFTFPVEDYKRVPVQPVYSVSYADQFMPASEMLVEPDSVTIYGEPFYLENITKVYTRPVRYVSLSESVNGVCEIDHIRGVRMSEKEVRYSLDVTRYVELASTYTVNVVNVPVGKEVKMYPSSVQVLYRCAFPLKSDPTDIVEYFIDYEDYMESVSGKCLIRNTAMPKGVISYDVNPPAVECVVSDRL